MSVDPYVAALTTAWRDELLSGRHEPSGPREYVYASARRDCVRRMALDLMHPEDDVWTEQAMERARRGNARERDVTETLTHVGRRSTPRFSVVESQRRYEIRDRDGALLIVGKIDGVLAFEDGTRFTFDVKSGDSIRDVDTLDDLDRSPWTRHHVDQLLAYLLAENREHGMLILDKPTGPAFLVVSLMEHLERAESFLRDARVAVDARFGRAPLPPYTTDRSECRRCPHMGKSCAPDLDFGSGMQHITDPETLAKLARREELRAGASEFDALDKAIKGALRGVEHAIAGDWEITGKWHGAKRYEVPDEIKQQYQTFDPRARFVLSIERVP